MKKPLVWSLILAIIGVLGFGGTVIKFDDRYVKAASQKEINKQIIENQKEITKTLSHLNSRIDKMSLMERKWYLEKMYPDPNKRSEEIKRELELIKMLLENEK